MTQDKYNTKADILQDVKHGRLQPWRPKKIKTLRLADSFQGLGYDKKAMRVRYCGSTLVFLKDPETGEKMLHSADFCRERLCPMCQWRKTLKVFYQVGKVMDRAQVERKDGVPVFLTLTVRNCGADALASTLDTVFKGWNRVVSHSKTRRIVYGWFRALEVTYNERSDTFHPHIHAILMVDKGYFKGKDYMETKKWVGMWRGALGLDYDPICHIRKVKSGEGERKAVAEVAKYTLKDTDFLRDDSELTDRLVKVLSSSLKGRRLFAFGGLLKRIAKQLGVEEVGGGDLVHIDDRAIRDDLAKVLEVYHWNFGLANYFRR